MKLQQFDFVSTKSLMESNQDNRKFSRKQLIKIYQLKSQFQQTLKRHSESTTEYRKMLYKKAEQSQIKIIKLN